MKFDMENLIGQRVEVYLDLNKGHLCWSLRSPETGLVLNYDDIGPERIKVKIQDVALRNAKFVVQPAGPARVRKTGKKDVHAWVVGELAKSEEVRAQCTVEVTYNAFKYTSFVQREQPEFRIDTAKAVFFQYPKVFCQLN